MPPQHHLTDLPPELLRHILEFLIIANPLLARSEKNIKNLCNLELISKQFGENFQNLLENYWKIILFQFINLRLEVKNGREVVNSINVHDHWKKKDEIVEKLKKKSNKRIFGILKEAERRRKDQFSISDPYSKRDVFKLCVSGPGGSGIHSFINRYLNDQFNEQYDYSLDEVFYKNVQFNETELKLEIWENGFRNDYYMFHECKFNDLNCS